MGARAWWRARCTEVAAAVVCTTAALAGCGADPDLPIPGATQGAIDRCDWPMWGHGLDRTFSYPCRTDLSPSTVGDLERRWFFNTADVVTSTPAVVDDTVYVGDWSGRFYALRREDGRPRWTYDTEVHDNVYSGQIVSSRLRRRRRRRADGLRGGRQDRLRAPGRRRAPALAPRAAAGGGRPGPDRVRDVAGRSSTAWSSSGGTCTTATRASRPVCSRSTPRPVRSAGRSSPRSRPAGCGDVWGSASVDVERGLVFAGSANCPSSPEGWGPYTEALFALDLDTGEPLWSFQPHDPNNDDFDFAGAPNLFEDEDGRELVGLGNKDAVYYAVDRATGEEVWRRKVAEPGITRRGSNFSTGGFIGPTAYADGTIVGGTAVGRRPVPPRHRRHHRRDPLAAAGGRRDVRGLGRGERRRVRRRHRLHAARPRPADRQGALAPGDDRRRGRRRGGGRQRRHRGSRHPRARRRRSRAARAASPCSRSTPVRRSRPPPRRPPATASTSTTAPEEAPAQACVGAPCPFALRPRRATAGPDAERRARGDPRSVDGDLPGRGPRPARGVAAARAARPSRTAPTPTASSCPKATTTRKEVCCASSTRT